MMSGHREGWQGASRGNCHIQAQGQVGGHSVGGWVMGVPAAVCPTLGKSQPTCWRAFADDLRTSTWKIILITLWALCYYLGLYKRGQEGFGVM